MSKNRIKNFRSRLDYACGNDDLRPFMQYIHFVDGYAFATDSHCIIIQCLKFSGFSDEDIGFMNDNAIYKKSFMQIYKAKVLKVTEQGFDDGEIVYKFKQIKTPINFKQCTLDIQNYQKGARKNVGINRSVVEKALKSMYSEYETHKLTFCKDRYHPIFVTTEVDESLQLCIVMPKLINEI